MLNIYITFDYELFFNETEYNEQEVLITPTYEIARDLNSRGISGTFFVDMSSVIRYMELGFFDYPDMVKEQILELYKQGHDIELHTHPHWYNSVKETGKWIFDNSSYCLSGFDDARIIEIISKEKELLEEIIRSEIDSYFCMAYRAGGFCVQPYDKIGDALSKTGIKIDSSICTGSYKNNGIHAYNFRKVPRKRKYYWRELTKKDNCAGILELPIGTIENKFLKLKIWKFMPKLNPGILKGKPSPSGTISVKKANNIKKMTKKIIDVWTEPVLLCFDGLHYRSIISALEYIEKKSTIDDEKDVVLLCHPKFATPITMDNFRLFLDESIAKHPDWKYKTVRDIQS